MKSNETPLRASARQLKQMEKIRFKPQTDALIKTPYPWDIQKSYHQIKDMIDPIDTFERRILCRIWLAHRSLGSDNHIAHASGCAYSNLVACVLAGVPPHQFRKTFLILNDKIDITRPYTGRGEGNTLSNRLSERSEEIYGSCWEQYAQAHFGISPELSKSLLITIKVAQSAKPRSGGKLPAEKVIPMVADARNVIPGIDLETPPPHHNIYSIEDLKDVIDQLKKTNPNNKISVKVVSQPGIVETVKGCAKAGADMIELSLPGGGTGATTEHDRSEYGQISNIFNQENVIANVHQGLIDENYRNKVLLYVDGQIQTAQDIATTLASGADIVGLGTAAMIMGQGCIKANECEKNTCPAGIQTWDPELVKKFKGSPEKFARYTVALAKETARLFRERKVSTIKEAIGNGSLLKIKQKKRLIQTRELQQRPTVHPIETTILKEIQKNKKEYRFKGNELNNTVHNFPVAVSSSKVRSKKNDVFSITIKGPSYPGSGLGAFTPKNLEIIGTNTHTDARFGENSTGTLAIATAGDAALMGINAGSITHLKSAENRYAILAKGGKHCIEQIGKFGLNYVFGGTFLILGSIGEGFGAAYKAGDVYLPKNTPRKLFHTDSTCLKELPIQDHHIEECHKILHRHLEFFPESKQYKTLLLPEEFKKKFMRLNPHAESLNKKKSLFQLHKVRKYSTLSQTIRPNPRSITKIIWKTSQCLARYLK